MSDKNYELDLELLLNNFQLSLCDGLSFLSDADLHILKQRLLKLHHDYNFHYDNEIIDAMTGDHFGG